MIEPPQGTPLTFRDVGYQSGDRLVLTQDILITSQFSTTSSSFTSPSSPEGLSVTDLSQFPNSVTVEARGVLMTGSTMDVAGDYRVSVNVSGTTFNTPAFQESGVAQVNSTGTVEVTSRGTAQVQPEIRSDGTNTVSLFDAAVQFEIVI